MGWPASSHPTVEDCLAFGHKKKRTPGKKRSYGTVFTAIFSFQKSQLNNITPIMIQ